MTLKSSISISTRVADLDALRHVNNRKYEQFCEEGRFKLLEQAGYPLQRLFDEGLSLQPLASFVKFSKQQPAGIDLHVQSELFPLGEGVLLWNHVISQPDGEAACQLQAKTRTLDRHQRPLDLFSPSSEEPGQLLIEAVPEFSGRCTQVSSNYSAIYTDMGVFGSLPMAAYWRMFEEGRHGFGRQLGLTLERLVQLDTHIFWISGTYRCYRPVRPGQRLALLTWLERVSGIRATFRQEIRSEDGSEVLGASREAHLIVSLSKSRPRKLPPEIAAMAEAYTEYMEDTP